MVNQDHTSNKSNASKKGVSMRLGRSGIELFIAYSQ